MPDKTLTTRALQTTAILLSTLAGGAAVSISAFTIPRLLESPTSLMLQQWQATYLRGRSAMRPLGSAAALVYLALAQRAGSRPTAAAYLASAVLCAAIGPYTWAVMAPTNRMLLARAARAREEGVVEGVVGELGAEAAAVLGGEEERKGDRALLDHWGVLNLGRAAMVVTAGVVGLWVSL